MDFPTCPGDLFKTSFDNNVYVCAGFYHVPTNTLFNYWSTSNDGKHFPPSEVAIITSNAWCTESDGFGFVMADTIIYDAFSQMMV